MTHTTRLAAQTSVSCNGLKFPVNIWGTDDGRPVLLLHGFPQEPSTWDAVAVELGAGGLQLFAPYQRGYVASTRDQSPIYTFPQFVDDALGIATELGLERFDVMGFGIGGVQAWMLAALHPGRVRSLVALRYPHPAAFAHGLRSEAMQQEKWQQLQRDFGARDLTERARTMLANEAAGLQAFLHSLGLPQPFIVRYRERLKDPESLIGAFSWERAISLDDFAKVPAVRVPTLLIWSEGVGLSRTTVQSTRDYVRAPYKEVLLQGAGHFLLECAPTQLLDHLNPHFASC